MTFKTEIRVRYADTDQMQFVYNGKYLEYFEVGRTELIRSSGLSYSKIESEGYQLPLIEAHIKYISAAFYDDILVIETSLKEIPKFKMKLEYKIFRKENNELVTEGYTEHIFVKKDTKKPVRPPKFFVDAINKYY
ncbi:MAG TPA: thioesterase family protein [Ignavibacteriaceae bacterium]|nr:thioesterase family protein [Ignavibacteriaceae bacterium]